MRVVIITALMVIGTLLIAISLFKLLVHVQRWRMRWVSSRTRAKATPWTVRLDDRIGKALVLGDHVRAHRRRR